MGLIIKQNTRNIDEMCAICGGQVVPNVPIVLCRDDDFRMVCITCGVVGALQQKALQSVHPIR
jgi:hypothetical protein